MMLGHGALGELALGEFGTSGPPIIPSTIDSYRIVRPVAEDRIVVSEE
jgi:hypothetical protein